jgi:hypothetical protein
VKEVGVFLESKRGQTNAVEALVEAKRVIVNAVRVLLESIRGQVQAVEVLVEAKRVLVKCRDSAS